MIIVIHRVNTISALQKIPAQYGVEIDLRADGGRIILNHEPFEGGDDFEEYLKSYHHRLMVLNIKEAGIEQAVLDLVKKYDVKNYFLLDVEFPYIYRAARQGVRAIAMRYSEDESLETALKYKGIVDWLWIDTNTKLPLTAEVISKIKDFKICLVCPERWGRPEDIPVYRQKMMALHFIPNAVMTALPYAECWETF